MMWRWLLNLEFEFNKMQHITTNYSDQNSVISPTYIVGHQPSDASDIHQKSGLKAPLGEVMLSCRYIRNLLKFTVDFGNLIETQYNVSKVRHEREKGQDALICA